MDKDERAWAWGKGQGPDGWIRYVDVAAAYEEVGVAKIVKEQTLVRLFYLLGDGWSSSWLMISEVYTEMEREEVRGGSKLGQLLSGAV